MLLIGPFENFDSIPSGYRIGTSAPRRAKMLQDQRSDLRFVPIRGNIQTRIDLIAKQAWTKWETLLAMRPRGCS